MMPAVFALCLGSIAGYARFTRAELSEVLTGEFMLLARTKGLTKKQAILRHAMRNSMVVIFPSILSEFIGVLSGSLIIEQIFAVNGIGQLYLKSIFLRDYDVFMATSMFYTVIGLTGDYWISNANLEGPLNYFVGVGFGATVGFDKDIILSGAARLPVGINMFFADGVVEPYIQIVPQLPVQILPSIAVGNFSVDAAAGIRFWF